ncbi:TPA: P22AR C-terminal domain-containing protein [Escherichia coli]
MYTQLVFHDTKFNVVNHHGQIWLTSAELASALQYANVRAVTGLYNRYKDEFTEFMSLVLKMNTKGFGGGNSEKDTRIFSLRGAHLVAMLSKTPVAKEFRRWVLDILDREVGETVIQPIASAEETYTLTLTRSELCSLCWVWNAAEYMREKIELVYPALRNLNSDYAPSFYSMAFEYPQTLEAGRQVLERETKSIEPRTFAIEDANWRTVLPRLRKTITI